MADVEGVDEYTGTRPLIAEQQEEIRLGTFSPLSALTLAYNDPHGCLRILQEDNYLVKKQYVALTGQVHQTIARKYREMAQEVIVNLENKISRHMRLPIAKAEQAEEQYRTARAIRRNMLNNAEKVKEQKKAETEGEAYTKIGIDDNSLNTQFDLEESRVQKLIADVSPNLQPTDFACLLTPRLPGPACVLQGRLCLARPCLASAICAARVGYKKRVQSCQANPSQHRTLSTERLYHHHCDSHGDGHRVQIRIRELP